MTGLGEVEEREAGPGRAGQGKRGDSRKRKGGMGGLARGQVKKEGHFSSKCIGKRQGGLRRRQYPLERAGSEVRAVHTVP